MSKTRNLANSAPQFNSLIVPTGNTTQRPAVTAGQIRFNTDLGTLESANGVYWANVGSGSASSGGGYSANTTDTGYFALPQGTVAQRPANAANGVMRWNTSNSWAEMYTGQGGWQIIAGSYVIQYLLVAGGGGGGSGTAGGGGAGGVVVGTISPVTVGTSYSLVLGAGGAAVTYPSASNSGSNSTGFGQTAIGGGTGGGLQGTGVTNNPANGGSGGGQAYYNSGQTSPAGSGTSGQGYSGGASTNAGSYGGGGGGGGGGPGAAGGGGAGGTGYQWLDGNYYAGGGAGSNGGAISGGLGGGGASNNSGSNGTTNTGGGGGGNWGYSVGQAAGGGGSGVCILRYPGTPRGTGGTTTQSGGYTYHTFTGSGTFTA